MSDDFVPEVDLAKECGTHFKQLDAITTLLIDSHQFQAWYCSRRAAKTHGIALHDLKVALAEPGTNQIYTALTRSQAKEAMWRVTWVPMVDRICGLGFAKHNHTNQQTIFPNGSSVAFGGLDDLRHIQTFLGQNLRSFCSDESQGASSSLLKGLIEDVISPALNDNPGGKFLLAGMLPDVPAGYYYEALTSGRWLVRNWNRFQNPWLKENQEEALKKWLAVTGLSIDSPETRRRWFGELVFDPGATAYRFNPSIASWDAPRAAWSEGIQLEPGILIAARIPPGVDSFSIGTDPGTRDRWAMVLWGWNSRRRDVCYQIAEWVTPRNAMKRDGTRTDWNDAANVADTFFAHYETITRFYRDAGSSQETLDLFGRYIGRMVVKAANKQDLGAQVERMAAMLATGRLKVIAGSQLEADLKLAKWDDDARADGRYEWDNKVIHPDVADAARYGLQGYIELPGVPAGPALTGDRFLAWQEEQAWKNRDWAAEARAKEGSGEADLDVFSKGF